MNVPRKVRIGTCAWSFEDWRGAFYPSNLSSAHWLDFYSRHLPAVEVDSTFYHAPSPKAVAHWMAQTPADFTFCCKFPREITHERKLRDCRKPLEQFLEALWPLRPKLGCVLAQLPPSFAPGPDEAALREFVHLLPPEFRFAIEFRHRDWHLPRIVHLFEKHRVCWVWNDLSSLDQQNRPAFGLLPQPTDLLYVRLLGDPQTKYRSDGSRIHHYDRLKWPRERSVESWGMRIARHLAQSSAVYIFANNHFEGFAPETCQRIGRQLAVDLRLPEREERALEPVRDRQMQLF